MQLPNKKTSVLVLLVVIVVAFGATAAGYYAFQSDADTNDAAVSQETNNGQSEEGSEVEMEDEDAATGTIIKTGDSEFGSILFDSENQAIYIWEVEKSETAECYGSCAVAWPPVLTEGAPIASGDVNGELLGTTERSDGTTQVTYNGHPLYYYAHEEPGEVECHNVSTHGGLWWVIHPNGVRAE